MSDFEERDSPATGVDATRDASPTWVKPNGDVLIAPWWHCGLLVAIIVAASAFGSMHSAKSSMASHHLANYGVTLAWEWALASVAYWGIRLRKTPLRLVLGEQRHGRREIFIDIGAGG